MEYISVDSWQPFLTKIDMLKRDVMCDAEKKLNQESQNLGSILCYLGGVVGLGHTCSSFSGFYIKLAVWL